MAVLTRRQQLHTFMLLLPPRLLPQQHGCSRVSNGNSGGKSSFSIVRTHLAACSDDFMRLKHTLSCTKVNTPLTEYIVKLIPQEGFSKCLDTPDVHSTYSAFQTHFHRYRLSCCSRLRKPASVKMLRHGRIMFPTQDLCEAVIFFPSDYLICSNVLQHWMTDSIVSVCAL